MSPVPSGHRLPAHPELRELRPRFPPQACSPTTHSSRFSLTEMRRLAQCSFPSHLVQLHRDLQNPTHFHVRLNRRLPDRCPSRRLLQRHRQFPAALPDFRLCPIQRMKLLRSESFLNRLILFHLLHCPQDHLERLARPLCLTRIRLHRAKVAFLLVCFLPIRQYSTSRNHQLVQFHHPARCFHHSPLRSRRSRPFLLTLSVKCCPRNILSLIRWSRFLVPRLPTPPIRQRRTRPPRFHYRGRHIQHRSQNRHILFLCPRLRSSSHNLGQKLQFLLQGLSRQGHQVP
jgi:hypothetical protein